MPPSRRTEIDRARHLIQRRSVVARRDFERLRLPTRLLTDFVRDGSLIRLERGLYLNPAFEITEHHSLVEAAARVPGGVVCLLSALRFHKLGTQSPPVVWMALQQRAWQPTTELPIRWRRMPSAAFQRGRKVHRIEGVAVAVYEPAKTVVDCFQFRDEVGLDVVIEALRAGWAARRFALREVIEHAQAAGVADPLRPYLEMLS